MGYGGVANTSGWPPLIVSIASAGSYLYAGGVIPDAWQEYYSASIYGFTVGSSGTPASITGSPWAVPTNGESRSGAVVTDLSGKFLYAFTGSNLYGYSVSPSGSLTELAGFPIAPPNYSGNNNMPTISMVFEPRNKFLYFTDWGNGVRGYSFNSTTGALTELTGSPFAATGNSNCGLAADPSGTFLYSGDDNTNSVTGFTINQTTGVLTQMTTGPYQASQSWDLVSMGITH
jgi:6-phosphogluconolactonase (cycloisomerase 2 family)